MDASEVDEINKIIDQYQQEALILQRANWKEQSGLSEYWGEFLNLFEMFVLMTTASSIRFNNKFRKETVNDVALRVLIRLHAKACQAALAISSLLQAGLADSANVCWRSLHEINVIARFIDKYTKERPEIEIAQRYLDHDIVFHYNYDCLVRRHKDQLKIEPLRTEDFRKLQEKYDDLNSPNNYGPKFKEPFGWAAPILNKRPSFEELERRVELDYWRPYYVHASMEIHTGPGSLFSRLGLKPFAFDKLLTGPSKWGLSVPASNTAYSLLQITATLLLSRQIEEHIDRLNALKALVEEIYRVSELAEEALEVR
ncbi:MAG: DUF5677 domain-containing protein [Caldilineaceae bacterium]|nr:DUF5677 domain-containing protein [Caldilineaceae bacterium]